MMALDIALRDIALAQETEDITITQTGRIIAATAARISAVHSAVSVDPLDLALAVAASQGMSERHRLALVQAALRAAV